MSRRRVGDPSSKYAYNPDQLGENIEDKNRVCNEAFDHIQKLLDDFMDTDYRYRDNQPMSFECKWSILMEACRRMMDKMGIRL